MGVNRISRFTMPTNRVDINPDSEQQMLDVVVQRSTCCHAGGDLEFDTQGNLYLVTGDDTNPFESSAFTPIDERDGREPFDAQRSSANTADLRGSAIRISPNEDGSYDIPDGNLIDTIDGASEEEVYPELYAIGFRNPFTAAVDPESDVLYLADYGPDSGGWSASRGPMGTVEYARVDEPGFYGWPYFTGHSVPYKHYDFDTGESGRIFDPENPTNDSVNNSGLEELPATEGSFVMSPYNWGGYMNYPDEFEEYVPYSSVEEVPFPQVTGGAPMLGTVFRDSEEYSYQALPSSYDGKVFMMEYGSNWIKYATVDEEGNALEVDPFLPDRGFSSPFDMAVGPDGALYVMERGGGSITRFGLSSSVLPVGLSVEGLSGEIRVTTDQEIDITATITNGSSTAVDGVELSLDPSSDDIGVGDGSNTSIGSLGGGASETAEWTVTLPGDLGSGDYSIEAVATYTSNGSEFEVTSALTFAIAG
jgi:glucose/arabinose dehydrogenase